MPGQFPELDAAVRRLYDTFAARHRRAQLGFCAHCVSPQEAEALVKTPLRDLGVDLLRVFVHNAISWTWGTPEDLWYYLPRVLEFVAIGEFNRYDISGLFTAMGVWREWPQDQQDALIRYLTALWRATIAGYWFPGKLDVRDVLEAAGDLGVPVDSCLREWEKDGSEAAALHLAWLIRHSSSLRGGNPAAEWSRAVGQWMMGPAARRVLALALAAASTPEIAANLSGALGILDSRGPAV